MYGIALNLFWLQSHKYLIQHYIVGGPRIEVSDESDDIKTGGSSLIYTAKVEKFSSEEFTDDYFKRVMRDEKLGAKVITFLGHKYWKPCEEARKRKAEIFIPGASDVKSKQDLNKFCKLIERDRFEGDTFVNWKIYLFPDYSAEESAYVVIGHICLKNNIERVFKAGKLWSGKGIGDDGTAVNEKWPE